MNFQAFSTGLDDDQELIQVAIRCFLEEIDRQLAQLQTVVRAEDDSALAKLAHTLKGITAVFAATRLVEANLALELAAKAHRRDECIALCERVQELTEQLKTEVRSLQSHSSHP